jgi:endonuclease/exonuclease/phosphatase (EEP) superfamily protein YafD
MSVILATVAALIGWFFVVLVAVGAVTTAFGATPNPFIAAVQGAAPRLIPVGVLLGAILGLLPLVVGRYWSFTALPGGMLLAASFAWLFQLLPLAPVNGEVSTPAFRLLSVNLLITNDDVAGIASDILAVDADVVITLETAEPTRRALMAHLTGYRVASTGEGARGAWASIWVHERVEAELEKGEHRLEIGAETLPGIRYRVETTHGTSVIRLVGVHLHAPSTRKDGDTWAGELDELAQHARANGEHLVLAGDFNAGHAHPALGPLLTMLRDAGRTTWGTGTPTWPVLGAGEGAYRWSPTMLDLDHILTGSGLGARGYRTIRVAGSDHLGIASDVHLRARTGD